jgi:CheY-like chemotaxis protein
VAISVIDTGIGIDDNMQQRIFEAFAQGDGTTARLYGGTGLGLSISRELVGLLGGEITVTSRPGQGSTFTVYLPLGQPATGSIPESPKPARPRAGSLLQATRLVQKESGHPPDLGMHVGLDGRPFEGLRVLVVDDDFRNVFAMTALLERGGAAVTAAESGPGAIAALERTPDIDIVLMDIMMPGMDGYAVIRAVRALEPFESIPIIAVTGKVVVGERERCIDAGANDYVPKPVNTAELLAAIGPWLPATAQPAA